MSAGQQPTSARAEDADELYRAHAPAMYRIAVSIVRDHGLAEDVVQESLVKAWRNLSSFRGESSMRTWLLRITHNTAISMLRAMRDTPLDPDSLPQGGVDSTEHVVIADAFIAAFEEALFDLDDISRAAVTLREVEDLSYERIAAVLGVPVPTVKTRLFRARRKLAQRLAEWRST